MGKNKNYQNFYKNNFDSENVKAPIEEIKSEEPVAEAEPIAIETEVTPKEIKQKTATFAVIVNAKRVNMRKDPNKEAEVIKVLDQGTKVMILDTSVYAGSWWKISVPGGHIGYMMSKYLKEIK